MMKKSNPKDKDEPKYKEYCDKFVKDIVSFIEGNMLLIHINMSGMNLGDYTLPIAEACYYSSSLNSAHLSDNNVSEYIQKKIFTRMDLQDKYKHLIEVKEGKFDKNPFRSAGFIDLKKQLLKFNFDDPYRDVQKTFEINKTNILNCYHLKNVLRQKYQIS